MAFAGHYLLLLDRESQKIDGESEGRDHDHWIDVTSWNWDVTDASQKKSGPAKDATGRGTTSSAGKASAGSGEAAVQPSLFTFTKPVDTATTTLMRQMEEGYVLHEATFRLIEEFAAVDRYDRPGFQLDVVLAKVKVVSYKLSVRASEHRVDMEETWGLNYTTIRFDYVSQAGMHKGGMNATFDRDPASDKGASERPSAAFNESLKQSGWVPAPLGANPPKRG